MSAINNSNKRVLFFFAIGMVFLVTGTLAYFYYQLKSDKIYSKVLIGDLNVSGYTKEQANNLLQKKTMQINNAVLKLTYKNKEWVIPYENIDARYNIPKAVEQAYSFGRQGSVVDRTKQIIGLKSSQKISIDFGYDQDKLLQELYKIKSEIDTQAANAKIIQVSNGRQVVPDSSGQNMDIDVSLKSCKESISNLSQNPVALTVKVEQAQVTEESLKNITQELGGFETTFKESYKERAHNIRIALSRINSTILRPNEVFSLDKKLLERTNKNGYLMAKAYHQGEVVEEVGGGVCQIATTLYDAVLYSNLQVIERNSHSMMVDYVKPGFDAAISDKGVDLKFKNSMQNPIYLCAFTQGNKIIMKIYGSKPANHPEVVLENEIAQTIAPEPETLVADPTLKKGQKAVEVKSKAGGKVYLYKNSYINGKLASRELVSENIYKPLRGKIRIGS